MRKSLVLGILLAATSVALPAHAYRLMGVRWPNNQIPVKHSINARNVPGVSETNARNEVLRAFQAWTDVPCSRIAFAADTRAVTTWNSGDDTFNKIYWQNAGWQYGSATLGVTTPMYYQGQSDILDADIVFNAHDYSWTTGTGNYCQNCVDVFSIALHEEGHFLGLDHSAQTSAVMYASYPGSPKQTLTDDDKQGACAVYPQAAPGSVPFGGSCVSSGDCQSGLSCGRANGSTSSICTQACGSGCPSGYSCQAGSSGNACYPAAGALGDLCKACGSGPDCASGLCVATQTFAFCTRTCTQGSCPSGYDCYSAGSSNVCVPVAGACANNCGAGCPAGQACVGGSCQFTTGGEGDACPQGQCGGGLVCVSEDGSATNATCRRECVSPGSTSGCPTGQTCYALQDGGGVCFPDDGGSSGGGTQGATCSQTAPCASGFWCVATSQGATSGTCLGDCNPRLTATCAGNLKCNSWGTQAPAGSAGGYCYGPATPPPPSARECEPCGSGVATCADGLVCMRFNGGAAVCRKGCSGNSMCGGNQCVRSGTSSPSSICECASDKPPQKQIGEACGESDECVFGSSCVDDGSGEGSTCHRDCTLGSSTCGSALACRDFDGTHVCAPKPLPVDPGTGDDAPRRAAGCGGCSGTDSASLAAFGSLALGLLRRRRGR